MEGPMEEYAKEADTEIDVGEAPPTGVSVLEQAPELPVTMLAMAGIWAGGPSSQVSRAGHQLEGSGKGARQTGGVAAPSQDR